jgi:hypothetical protein
MSCVGRFGKAGLCLLFIAIRGVVGGQEGDPLGAAAERERIQALVNEGALPRKALAEAEAQIQKTRWEQTLNATLLHNDLAADRIPDMIEAAANLLRLAQDDLEHTLKLVEAGALPANRLEPARQAVDLAQRQFDLAREKGRILRERAAMVRAEEYLEELEDEDLAWYFDGPEAGPVFEEDLLALDAAFYEQFGQPLPISARGQTELHRSLGFNHIGRADIPLHPDDAEGMFLIHLLESWGIPYLAFRSSVPGQSTGPHIHIGPRSEPVVLEPASAAEEPAKEPSQP